MHAIPALVRLRAVLMPQRCGRVLAVLSLFFFFCRMRFAVMGRFFLLAVGMHAGKISQDYVTYLIQ